jgi:cytoskeleton protein RodZ
LPAAAYAKGFLRSYAEWLGLDGQLFLDELNSRLAESEPALLSPPQERPCRAWARPSSLVLISIIMAGLLGILAWRFGGSNHPTNLTPAPQLRANSRQATRVRPPQSHRPPVAAAMPIGHLLLRATGRCWVSVHLDSRDGPLLYEGTLSAGAVLRYTLAPSRPQLWLRLGDPAQLAVSLNGTALGTLPRQPVNLLATSHRLRRL